MPTNQLSDQKFSELFDTFLSLRSSYLAAASVTAMRDTRRSFLRHIPD
jgi:hypothetical protein